MRSRGSLGRCAEAVGQRFLILERVVVREEKNVLRPVRNGGTRPMRAIVVRPCRCRVAVTRSGTAFLGRKGFPDAADGFVC